MKFNPRKSLIEQEALTFHRKQALHIKELFGLPPFLELQFIACRKQVQLAFFVSTFAKWESIATECYGKRHPYEEHRLILQEVMRKEYLPKIEGYYGCSVEGYYFFEPHYKDDYIYGFSVKNFSTAIFKNIDQQQAVREEKLAGVVSAYIRQVYGRGPGKVIVSILNNRFVVFQIKDLISTFLSECALEEPNYFVIIIEILKKLMDKTLDYACVELFEFIPEKFIEIDLLKNEIFALAIIEPLNKDDFGTIVF